MYFIDSLFYYLFVFYFLHGVWHLLKVKVYTRSTIKTNLVFLAIEQLSYWLLPSLQGRQLTGSQSGQSSLPDSVPVCTATQWSGILALTFIILCSRKIR